MDPPDSGQWFCSSVHTPRSTLFVNADATIQFIKLKKNAQNFYILRYHPKERVWFTWSAHQYQIEAGVWPSRKPSQGISESLRSRSMTKALVEGSEQVNWEDAFGEAAMLATLGVPPLATSTFASADRLTSRAPPAVELALIGSIALP